MKLEVGKSYITECGYIATLGEFFRDVNPSPGLNNVGESTADNEMGWLWAKESDGQIFGLKPEWCEKLKIIAEFKGKIPSLPEGYEWKYGYPCLESPKGGDLYIHTPMGHLVKASDNCSGDLKSRRFTVKKSLTLSEWENVQERHEKAYYKGLEQMKKETAIKVATGVTKFAASWGFRILNYWVFEPAAGIGRPIMKSVRYATFIGGLVAAGYGYYHPQETINFVKSCLPTVTVESPEILK